MFWGGGGGGGSWCFLQVFTAFYNRSSATLTGSKNDR